MQSSCLMFVVLRFNIILVMWVHYVCKVVYEMLFSSEQLETSGTRWNV